MRRSAAGLAIAAGLALALAACVGGAGSSVGGDTGSSVEPAGSAPATASPSFGLPSESPAISASPIPLPSASSPAPSPPARPIVVTTAAEAARRVLATDSRFRSIEPYDPNLIGQAAWYKVTTTVGGYRVVVRIGWGDCPAGCIDQHLWTYEVARTGEVGLVGQTGPAVPSGVIDGIGGSGGSGGNSGGGTLGVSGRVLAGPTCPVVRIPPDPNCADRPVAGAVLVVADDSGREVARTTSSSTGDFSIELPAGHYRLTPQPVAGLMGTPAPFDFTIAPSGPAITFDVQYDTGIR